ncbi:MAG: hypothetical protein KC502_20250 [Myxococcales bacterium]|nr:hypothetical protein [Myxococcales bacterium]
MSRICRVFLVAGCLCLGALGTANAAPPASSAAPDVPVSATVVGDGAKAESTSPALSDAQRTEKLAHIHTTLAALQQRRAKRAESMAQAPSPARRAAIGREIAVIDKRIEGARESFDALAADTTFAHLLTDPRRRQRNLVAEVEELLGPVIDAFRRVSARPRRIEQLRRQIRELTEQQKTARRAKKRLDTLLHFHSAEPWAPRVREARTRVEGIAAELDIRLDRRQRELTTELSDDTSWVDTMRGSASEFFGTKGKNILIATLAFVLVLLLALAGRRRLLEHRSDRMRWLKKPLGALYGGLAFVFASAASLLAFYLLNDVLLFTITLLVLSLLFWSFRHLAPKYVAEMRLVLNLGTVREGERVVWQGLPWRIDKLGIVSTLVNERIQGGTMHVAASELIGKHSRKVVEGEPWFPSKVGDWVKLKDGMFGEVTVQTPEQVVVREYGFAPVTYTTGAFIANRPQNFSGGFLIWFKVALDQSLQAIVADEVIPGLIAGVRKDLADKLQGEHPQMKLLSVTYDRADEGALLLMVQAEFTGDQAPSTFGNGRAIRLSMLRTCHNNGWKIAQNRLFADELSIRPSTAQTTMAA